VTNESVAIVAESKLFRAGIKSLIGSQLLVSMEADCAVETSRWRTVPNLILVDAVEGNEASVFVDLDARFPRSPVVFLLRHASREQALDLLRLGAHGVLGPDLLADALVLSLRLVLIGQIVVPSFAVDLSLTGETHYQPVGFDADADLTPRERQILDMIVHGQGNKAIGLALGIREPTVKFYVKNIMRKLRVCNRTQAAVWALNHVAHADNEMSVGVAEAAAGVIGSSEPPDVSIPSTSPSATVLSSVRETADVMA